MSETHAGEALRPGTFGLTFAQGLVRGLVGGVVPALIACALLRVFGASPAECAVIALGAAFASASVAIGDLRAETRRNDPAAVVSFLGGTLAFPIGMIPWLSPLGFWAGMRMTELPTGWELGAAALTVFPGLGLGLSRAVAARLLRSATVLALFGRALIGASVIAGIITGIHVALLLVVLASTGSTDGVVPLRETLPAVGVLYGAFLALASGHAAARPIEKLAMAHLEPAEG